jgi:hypothetical protein
MEIQNAFIGQKDKPSEEEVLVSLGPSAIAWNHLIDWIGSEYAVREQLWKSSGVKHGWSLCLVLKKRTILYLSPCANCFRVAFVLGDRALAAAHQSNLPAWTIQEIDSSPKYAEGTGIRIPVREIADLDPVFTLTGIKLAY